MLCARNGSNLLQSRYIWKKMYVVFIKCAQTDVRFKAVTKGLYLEFPRYVPSGLSIGNMTNMISFLSSLAIPWSPTKKSIIPATEFFRCTFSLLRGELLFTENKKLHMVYVYMYLPSITYEDGDSQGWILPSKTTIRFSHSLSMLFVNCSIGNLQFFWKITIWYYFLHYMSCAPTRQRWGWQPTF